ncbi:ATP-NAD kinase [Haloarcula marina]|uniref:ATP-NAD kinase n=1 Tax=Haloarcula marina TaxID=2961574 RepID=UPI0020B83EC4|nr:ATP-NAD kinase [Halomicroarcula marina]
MSNTVGVVGDAGVAEAVRDAGYSVVRGTPEDVPTADSVVAVGSDAVRAVATADGDSLVLPVDAGRGVRSVSRAAVGDAVDALDDATVERHPVLSVTVAGEPTGMAVWDVTVVTADAAHISEYAIQTPTDAVGKFRADGVTVATPAGSPGYARRIGGPILAPSDAVGVVAPVAPFATSPDHWVLPIDALSLSVERDEATVALFVDGTRRGTVDCGDAVSLALSGTARVAVVGASRSRFD